MTVNVFKSNDISQQTSVSFLKSISIGSNTTGIGINLTYLHWIGTSWHMESIETYMDVVSSTFTRYEIHGITICTVLYNTTTLSLIVSFL